MFMVRNQQNHAFRPLFKALQEVSENDPLPDPEENGMFHTHGDGWGLASVSENDYTYMRSLKPIYESGVPEIPGGTTMVHSRKASTDQPGGVVNDHPFYDASDNADFFLCHNGWIDKNTLPLDGKRDLSAMTDSEALLRYIVQDGGKDIVEKLEELSSNGVSFSLANVFVMRIERSTGKNPVVTAFYFTEKGKSGKSYEEFDKLYLLKGEGWEGVVSSSLLHSNAFPDYSEKREIQRGRVFIL